MLEGLKRWFSAKPAAAVQASDDIAAWAEGRQFTHRRVHGDGFVVDGRLGATPWRLEWGPSQRPYIQGHELRLRAELGLGSDLQFVVMNRTLQERMEQDVFEQYVEGVQTRIDNQTPPEMRWLVLYPKLAAADMAALKDAWVAVGSVQPWLQSWLAGPLAQALAGLRIDPATPVVLMIGRGRLMLRTAAPDVDAATLQGWLRVFEIAMREARRAADEHADASTHPSLWSTSALPDDEPK